MKIFDLLLGWYSERKDVQRSGEIPPNYSRYWFLNLKYSVIILIMLKIQEKKWIQDMNEF
jgi:hypothetical protein